jgi:glycosyltransferase involved in cell wall biosynthesis
MIVPNWNGLRDTTECLESLQRLLPAVANQTFQDFEVFIVDDCTPDEATVLFIRHFVKDRPNMHLVQNTENMRFIKTANKGIPLAKGDYTTSAF